MDKDNGHWMTTEGAMAKLDECCCETKKKSFKDLSGKCDNDNNDQLMMSNEFAEMIKIFQAYFQMKVKI